VRGNLDEANGFLRDQSATEQQGLLAGNEKDQELLWSRVRVEKNEYERARKAESVCVEWESLVISKG